MSVCDEARIAGSSPAGSGAFIGSDVRTPAVIECVVQIGRFFQLLEYGRHLGFFRLVPRPLERGERTRRQCADDGNHDQQFDQSKASFVFYYFLLLIR